MKEAGRSRDGILMAAVCARNISPFTSLSLLSLVFCQKKMAGTCLRIHIWRGMPEGTKVILLQGVLSDCPSQ